MTDQEMQTAIAEACEPKRFLIRKPIHDPFGYYRPGAHGYTGSIAEAWKVTEEEGRKYITSANQPDRVILEPAPISDYPNDLNAIHEATLALRERDPKAYMRYQQELIAQDGLYYPDAIAHQRCRAFLRAIGKWVETPAQKGATR